MEVELLKGGSYTDNRGSLSFVNQFEFKNIKRFYQIVHPDTSVIRAWQGHRIEHKYFYVSQGRFVVATVLVDDFNNPSPDLKPVETILDATDPAILSIPAGYANGLKALTPGSILMVYSNLSLSDSEGDRWAFDPSLWMDWNKYQK